MKNEQGFSLIELLIVVAIIAIIAAIAVPSLLTSRMAANEASGIQGCRTIGSGEVAYAATNNQMYVPIQTLIDQKFLDGRFKNGIDGYRYADADITTADTTPVTYKAATSTQSSEFAVTGTPDTGMGRFIFGIGPDQVVRYIDKVGDAPLPLPKGTGIGQLAAK